jgi:hypothetical protein
MFGVVSLGDAGREDLQLASLETHGPATASDTQFTSSAGRTFVAPSPSSLRAAGALLKPDKTSNTWPIPYSAMRTDTADDAAYPGTMVVYTDVPTQGLPTSDASDYAKLLTFVAGSGQQPGTAQGQLPTGFLPLTTSNGLGSLADYTDRAAAAVAAQQGAVPAIVGSAPGGSSGSPQPGRTGTGQGSGPPGAPTQPAQGAPSSPGAGSSGTSPGASPSVPGSGSVTPLGDAPTTGSASQVAASTPSIPVGAAGLVLPLLLAFGIGAGLIGPAMVLRDGRRRRR